MNIKGCFPPVIANEKNPDEIAYLIITSQKFTILTNKIAEVKPFEMPHAHTNSMAASRRQMGIVVNACIWCQGAITTIEDILPTIM